MEVNTNGEDCADCQKKKRQNFFKRVGMKIGKGAAWLSTTTARPFMTAAGFIKGAVENGEKNKELVALYQFFMNLVKKSWTCYLKNLRIYVIQGI